MNIRNIKARWFAFILANPGFSPDEYRPSDPQFTREQHLQIVEMLRLYAVGMVEDKHLFCCPIAKWAIRYPERALPRWLS